MKLSIFSFSLMFSLNLFSQNKASEYLQKFYETQTVAGDICLAYKYYDSVVLFSPIDSNYYSKLYDRAELKYFWFLDIHSALMDLTTAERYCKDNLALLVVIKKKGMLYRFLGKYKKAIKEYNRANKLEMPKEFKVRERMWSYHSENIIDSVRTYKKNIKAMWYIENLTAEDLILRGESFFKLGKHCKAMADFDALVSRFPEGGSYYIRGIYRLLAGKRREGKADIQKATKFGYRPSGREFRLLCF